MTTNRAATKKDPPPLQNWENEGGAPPIPVILGPQPGLRGVLNRAHTRVRTAPRQVRRRVLHHDAAPPQRRLTWSRALLGALGLGAGTAALLLLTRRRTRR